MNENQKSFDSDKSESEDEQKNGRVKVRSRKTDDNEGYTWEGEYQRSWDIVQEDAEGSLVGVIAGLIQSGKRKRLLRDTTPLQRGIIRHMVLVLDLSNSMEERDFHHKRFDLQIKYASEFVLEFFEQNPISQLSIIGVMDGIAHRITDLHGNPQSHIQKLKSLRDCSGNFSLQNALEMARASLSHIASHGTREVLIIFGSILSSDPGDIFKTIDALVHDSIRVRIVGLAAEVAICKEICNKTNSSTKNAYGVVISEQHFRELLLESTIPPATDSAKTTDASLVMMGFPSKVVEQLPSLCACHSIPSRGGFHCPRCKAKVCTLPIECPSCSLVLILSTHLARSYHHLFPLKNWSEIPWSANPKSTHCFACQLPFPKPPVSPFDESTSSMRYACPSCKNHFCLDCDVFAHEQLHECYGCQCSGN
ncbi:General transcription and DNA repair factor IIH subunit ssl1 [Schizosaccharomyces pombe]|uniref:General transcription and DNA repair factor IIH subunit ssl1 n=1 Tax=Schizosaccharomyces pombe (strain 972 / ATCC 24843) TaxID=284812 RepID=TFH47_SCHPO|nr:transcription factor TFIIH complex subunit Ssl1 [Schizosaccharomyces pombe]O74995.1 RecName: Full=General transcription and DNA repair factor IIH subunit ssl1; Short=TFIIH subunit ssl1; AltName: Full=RNA polymerase II transcription factor B subunit ssl1; Short=TFB subunit ssl1; AltName: Full=Suppressor of stem-loop protein 1 homolog; Short=SSL1 homolog; AltName: Full=TFIIH basal transcription factor complex p47 subunit [Schizosaccharomyces pombe 972h-]AAC29144.1 TFIIH subunit p47 [Schizosaccha|eukprot:NP_587800.1 transcription factor TFIIH complex subunit Ssl1 [Schizosaccharomyces pombe]